MSRQPRSWKVGLPFMAWVAALSKAQLSLLGSLLLLYLLCLFECAELRRHLHLDAAMQQVIDGEYLDARIILALTINLFDSLFYKV